MHAVCLGARPRACCALVASHAGVQAGQVLKQERDQLAKLMGHLRQDYEAVERAKVAQQEELAALKERMKKKGAANNKMLVKVPCASAVDLHLCSRPAHHAACCLLHLTLARAPHSCHGQPPGASVQGGSSFNALMRAMKQQVVDTNTGERDPNLLFEINKMSMNKLQVFPDGELDVQAMSDPSNSSAFVKASGAVRTMQARAGGRLQHSASGALSGRQGACRCHTTMCLPAPALHAHAYSVNLCGSSSSAHALLLGTLTRASC
jgi:hypothetical protein